MVNLIHAGTIPPHEASEYVFSGQEAQSGLLHSIVLTTQAKPGTYQAKLVSRSTGSLYQVELLAKEILDINNAGVHPWSLRDDTESHIILFNHSKSDKKVGIFINTDSALWRKEMVLAASETREVSINELQNDQTPDDQGRRIPRRAKEGVADWMTPESGDVTGRLMVSSRDAAMARNFSCGTYTGVCDLTFSTLLEDIVVAGDLPMYTATASICIFPTQSNQNNPRCTLGNATQGTASYSWTVGATSIIELSSSAQQGRQSPNLLGVSPGTGSAVVTAAGGSCQSTGGADPTVVACPSSVSVNSNTSISITDNTTLHTGYGDMVSMLVDPASANSSTYQIVETVTPATNSCPIGVYPTVTQESSAVFNVGSGAVLDDNSDIVYPAIPNAFYDELSLRSTSSVLPASTTSCTATATHSYYCGGKLLGTFTDTTTITHGTENGGPASIVATNQK